MRKKRAFGWQFSCHQKDPTSGRVTWEVWELNCYFWYFFPGSSWLLEIPKEDNKIEQDVWRDVILCSTRFLAVRSYLRDFIQIKLRVSAGKVIVTWKKLEYWPKGSSTQFLVQLASIVQNGAHSQFLPSVVLDSEAYIHFFI